jgi:exopolysaccharide biosynthesis polyprenyl glycosylphosphotransferase
MPASLDALRSEGVDAADLTSICLAATNDGATEVLLPIKRTAARNRAVILSTTDFMELLRFETERANRSDSAFSVVIFSAVRNVQGDRAVLQDLSRLLGTRVRSTDVLGWYGNDSIAALLVHTKREGAARFATQLALECGHLPLRVTVNTYPTELTESLPLPGPGAEGPRIAALRGYRARPLLQRSVKRFVDILGALIAGVMLSPILLATAVVIKATSRGPVIFKQTRLGLDGEPFVFFKFRSMHVDADDAIHRDYVQQFITGQLADTGPVGGDMPLFKIEADPRITPFGDFIRKTSIDELPQLWNVLKGEMSLVGPRPPLPYEVDSYAPWHLRRILEAKPGMTGLWQVEGRSTTSFDEMVRLDLQYVETWSLWLDFKILLKTVKVVVTCKGAL